ncbi:MAG TPA: metalloregulator ArsR/SmtB family transcription factor [Vicinamibacterales bacterium]|jgi:DNA-binding transcriptional ArsR family regulator|nr:metalloregulator ArsR/SmtB family transcription factor [Vicinamibacterales bacterium]
MARDLDPIWKALADPSRRRILDLLRDGPRTTWDLCASFESSRFAVMKHLRVLEHARLILVRRRGRERWNYLNPIPIQSIYERWLTPYAALWAGELLDLKRTVERREDKQKARKDDARAEARTRL